MGVVVVFLLSWYFFMVSFFNILKLHVVFLCQSQMFLSVCCFPPLSRCACFWWYLELCFSSSSLLLLFSPLWIKWSIYWATESLLLIISPCNVLPDLMNDWVLSLCLIWFQYTAREVTYSILSLLFRGYVFFLSMLVFGILRMCHILLVV